MGAKERIMVKQRLSAKSRHVAEKVGSPWRGAGAASAVDMERRQ
jgi:hypothetical protein